jgi:hypothetical protein
MPMATITFNCPQCDYLCAFKGIYAGRRARCLRCNQVFIIPASDNKEVQKVEQPKDFDEPLPGFYEAVFKYSFQAILNKQSLATLLFILVVTTLKFFTIHLDYSIPIRFESGGGFTVHLPFGWVIAGFVWGGIFWCYAEIIYSTAFDVESLPEIYFGGGFGYVFLVLKSFYSFLIALLIVLLPAIIAKMIFSIIGVESKWLVFPFVILGLFLFPMAVLTVSISRDLVMLFRPDYFFRPIKKAFWHYLFLAGLFIVAWYLQYISPYYENVASQSNTGVLLNVLVALAIQIPTILAMRVAGLFYRHFGCYFKW